MISFLLPLKIIMLLGSSETPDYIPQWMSIYGYDTLIISLSFLVILFYLIHRFSERTIEKLVVSGSTKLLAHTKKSSLFENQEQVAFNTYMKYSKAFGGFVFVLIVLVGLALIYEKLFLFLLGYIILSLSIIVNLVSFSEKFYIYLEDKTSLVFNLFSSLGFFSVFLFMVYDLLSGTELNFIIILISLILSRQVLTQLQSCIQNIKSIYMQRIKINALFYHGHVLNPTVQSVQKGLWLMLEDKTYLRGIISNVLSDIFEKDNIEFKYSWYELRIHNIANFIVSFEKDNKPKNYLLQIFNTNRSSLARHQLHLLENESSSIFLELVGATILEQCHCHLFHFPHDEQDMTQNLNALNLEFMLNTIALPPKDKIIQMYKKSKPMITKRIHQYMLDRVSIAITNEQEQIAFQYCKNNLDLILSTIDHMPLQYINPNIGLNLIKQNNKVTAIFWGRWSIEPVGVNFQVGKLNELEKNLESIRKQRDDFLNISFESVAMVAYLSEFERLCNGMHYSKALNTVVKIAKYHKIVAKKTNNDNQS